MKPIDYDSQDLGLKVGKQLAEKGALERFLRSILSPNAAVRSGWDLQAIEMIT